MDLQIKRTIVASLASIRGGQYCAYCNKSLSFDEITIDHIVPIGHGGTWAPENLCMSCFECNNKRGSNINIQPLYREHGPAVVKNSIPMKAMALALDKALAGNKDFKEIIKGSKTSQPPRKPTPPSNTAKPLFSIADTWPGKKP